MNTKKLLTAVIPFGLAATLLALTLIMASCNKQKEEQTDAAPVSSGYTHEISSEDDFYTSVTELSPTETPEELTSSPMTDTTVFDTTVGIATVMTEPPTTTAYITTVAATKPVITKPVTTKPAVTKPVTTKPPVAVTVAPPEVKPPIDNKGDSSETDPVMFNGHLLTHPVLDEDRYVVEDILETSPVKYIENPEEAFPNATFTRKYMTRNDCYWYENQRMTVHGIVVHSTASPGVMATDWFDRWNRSRIKGEIGRDACVHAFTDDKNICQYLPWNHRGWHSRGLANSYFIGIEMCEPSTIKYENNRVKSYDPTLPSNLKYFNSTYNNTVDLCVQLCLLYDLNASDIISHKEGHDMNLASNHGDPEHWFRFHDKDMDDFRAAVAKKLKKALDEIAAKSTTEAVTVAPPEDTTMPEDTTLPVTESETAPNETTKAPDTAPSITSVPELVTTVDLTI